MGWAFSYRKACGPGSHLPCRCLVSRSKPTGGEALFPLVVGVGIPRAKQSSAGRRSSAPSSLPGYFELHTPNTNCHLQFLRSLAQGSIPVQDFHLRKRRAGETAAARCLWAGYEEQGLDHCPPSDPELRVPLPAPLPGHAPPQQPSPLERCGPRNLRLAGSSLPRGLVYFKSCIFRTHKHAGFLHSKIMASLGLAAPLPSLLGLSSRLPGADSFEQGALEAEGQAWDGLGPGSVQATHGGGLC